MTNQEIDSINQRLGEMFIELAYMKQTLQDLMDEMQTHRPTNKDDYMSHAEYQTDEYLGD